MNNLATQIREAVEGDKHTHYTELLLQAAELLDHKDTQINATRPAAPVEGLNLNVDKEWFEKKAAQEGDLEIGAGRRSSTLNPTPEEITELERIAFEALPQWAQDELTRLRAATVALVEGLETVQYECNEGDGWWDCGKSRHDHEQKHGIPTRDLVTRSQAEAIIAAEIRRERDLAAKQLSEVVDRMSDDYLALKAELDQAVGVINDRSYEYEALQANNAALTARVKELELIRDSHSRDTLQALLEKQALETQLAAAKDLVSRAQEIIPENYMHWHGCARKLGVKP